VSLTSPSSARTRTEGGELAGRVALSRSSVLLPTVGTLPGEAANVCFVPSDVSNGRCVRERSAIVCKPSAILLLTEQSFSVHLKVTRFSGDRRRMGWPLSVSPRGSCRREELDSGGARLPPTGAMLVTVGHYRALLATGILRPVRVAVKPDNKDAFA
jgi:hypothetical protein